MTRRRPAPGKTRNRTALLLRRSTSDDPAPDDGSLKVTVVLTGEAARTYRKLVDKGVGRRLRARLWYDGTTLFGREFWRRLPKPKLPMPSPRKKLPAKLSKAKTKASTKPPARLKLLTKGPKARHGR